MIIHKDFEEYVIDGMVLEFYISDSNYLVAYNEECGYYMFGKKNLDFDTILNFYEIIFETKLSNDEKNNIIVSRVS